MKLLTSSRDSATLGMLQSQLDSAGIQCQIRGEYLAPSMIGTAFDPELWILHDAQFADAKELMVALQATDSTTEIPVL